MRCLISIINKNIIYSLYENLFIASAICLIYTSSENDFQSLRGLCDLMLTMLLRQLYQVDK